MWRSNNHARSSTSDVDQKDDILAKFFCHDLPAHIVGDQQVVRRRSSADLLADLVGNLQVEENGAATTKKNNRQGINHIIEAFFNHFYVANKGDNSVQTNDTHTDADSVSSNSVSFESMEDMVPEESTSNRALVNTDESESESESESIAEQIPEEERSFQVVEKKTINYDWDDEEYVAPQQGLEEETPVSGADAAALFLAGALIVAQSFV